MDIHAVRKLLRTTSIGNINLRVTFYARVSSERDEQLNSLRNQEQFYKEYIKSNKNWTYVDGYIDEGISGITTSKRENFHRMIEDAKNGKFDYIVTKEISRFARNTLDSIGYTRQLLADGVAVFFQNDNINTIDEDSEFRLTIMAGVAQDEVRKLSSRIRFGHEQAIKNNVVLGNSHIYGFNKEKGKLSINEDEAKMVRLIFEKYAQGDYSTPKLEELLYNRGYRSYKGKKISRGVIQHIITNPKYKGYYVGNKVKVIDMFSKKQKFLAPEEWVMFKDETGDIVPAIVDEELWDRANRIYNARSALIKSRSGSIKPDNIFTGRIICTEHNHAYWLKSRIDRNGGNNSRWVCGHKIKNGAESCKSFAIMEKELLNILADVLKSISGSYDDIVEQFIEMYSKAFDNQDVEGEIKGLEEEIERINIKKDKILSYNIDGKISDTEFIKRNKIFNEDIEKREKSIEKLKLTQSMKENRVQEIKELRKTLSKYKILSPEDLTKNVIDALIYRIYATPLSENHMSLRIVLNTGEDRYADYYSHSGSSGNMFKKMIEAQEQIMAGKSGATPTGKQ